MKFQTVCTQASDAEGVDVVVNYDDSDFVGKGLPPEAFPSSRHVARFFGYGAMNHALMYCELKNAEVVNAVGTQR